MLTKSNNPPHDAFKIQDDGHGKSTIIFYHNAEKIEPTQADENGQEMPGGYEWDEYSIDVPSRPGLTDAVKNNLEAWLELAIEKEKEILGKPIRAQRDKLLTDSDKYMLTDMPTEATKAAWKAYRQALRDVPEQDGFPYTVVWPTAPEAVE